MSCINHYLKEIILLLNENNILVGNNILFDQKYVVFKYNRLNMILFTENNNYLMQLNIVFYN